MYLRHLRRCVCACMFASWALPAVAQVDQVFVEQVADGGESATNSNAAPPGAEIDVRGAPNEFGSRGNLLTLSPLGDRAFRAVPAGSANLAVIRQGGDNNSALSVVSGLGNLTVQQQRGVFNDSRVALEGNRNRLLVDQEGRRLESDVVGRRVSGRTVVHLQRGRANYPFAGPIDVGRLVSNTVVVVDTPRGRRSLSIDPSGGRTVTTGLPTTD